MCARTGQRRVNFSSGYGTYGVVCVIFATVDKEFGAGIIVKCSLQELFCFSFAVPSSPIPTLDIHWHFNGYQGSLLAEIYQPPLNE